MCGRTTIYDDAYRANRNGLESLSEILETNYPIDGAIIMLGTNDCKSYYKLNPYKIAKGIGMCIYSEYRKIAESRGTNVISAAEYAQPSDADQEHLTPEGHKKLAYAILNTLVKTRIV